VNSMYTIYPGHMLICSTISFVNQYTQFETLREIFLADPSASDSGLVQLKE
jgi:hypothetical protein